MELEVKPGAQIIFIKNDYERRWVNGTIGTIAGIDEDETLYVITEDGKEVDVKKDSWRNIRYRYNDKEKKIEERRVRRIHPISHSSGMGNNHTQKPRSYFQPCSR